MATKLRKYTNSPPKPVVGSSAQWNDGTTSRTMMLAQTSLNVPYTWSLAASGRKSTSEVIPSSRPNRREISGPKPTSSAAQYWVARALTAEALLSARETHHAEMQSLSHAEDAKRNVSASNNDFNFNGHALNEGLARDFEPRQRTQREICLVGEISGECSCRPIAGWYDTISGVVN